ncbi:sensor histidine kinase [Dactylosporangium matsuzakiense]|uniref:histidine kinase n=1 Tax=Dactylosporangium matsuzakiense TaxID=53360 RepID=A0A9W6KEM3_9ACTN|nr:HAMP domain-containing sensor histidine kinase [Dactylosporangium matsuzakiense]UWZ42231.1 HAMP domain-containing histidine kinase [Dactylosporangium matsuzakiense]GLK99882.1 two-component sensor histidine kinase [Dactylosporangium matsuzakiense]
MSTIGLRSRVVGGFAAGALLLSAMMAVAAYEVTRGTLLSGRERVTLRAVSFDVRTVSEGLATDSPNVAEVLRSLDTGGNRRVLLQRNGRWYARNADVGFTAAVPPSLLSLVQSGQAGVQRVRVEGVPAVIVGVPLAGGGALYEIDSLQELDHTLVVLGWVLAMVAAATACAGAALGWYAARYVLTPLRSVADAARGIADGDLDARLDAAAEPDLRQLTTSFNRMVDRLSERMERDRRFAADVSHELRSPLQTLAAAASVLERRREHLDARTALAAGLIVQEIDRFQDLVDDLLVLARSDQPAERKEVDVAELIGRVCREHRLAPQALEIGGSTVWKVDRRRVEQIMSNLLDNADRYGGGAVAVRMGTTGDYRYIEVDDEGPGISDDDKAAVFSRFVRGRASGARGADDGTGLGLALVAQHAAAHGGRAVALDRPGGGARLRVELRVEPS